MNNFPGPGGGLGVPPGGPRDLPLPSVTGCSTTTPMPHARLEAPTRMVCGALRGLLTRVQPFLPKRRTRKHLLVGKPARADPSPASFLPPTPSARTGRGVEDAGPHSCVTGKAPAGRSAVFARGLGWLLLCSGKPPRGAGPL